VPAGTAYGNTIFSWSGIQCSSPSRTNIVSAGKNSSEGLLGSHPSVVCKICFTPGHTTVGCVFAFAIFNAVDTDESVWYPDSAAGSHMTPNEGNLLIKYVYNGTDCVQVRNESLLPIKHVGSCYVSTVDKPLIVRNVFHVSHLQHNLLSVKRLYQDNNCIVVFDPYSICIKDKTSGKILLHTSSTGNVYPLTVPASFPSAFAILLDPATSWHCRLGHCGARILSFLKNINLV